MVWILIAVVALAFGVAESVQQAVLSAKGE
jgi:hypothetical protein